MNNLDHPTIVIAGVSGTEELVTHELRRRGFIVRHCNNENGLNNFALGLSKRLVAKIAVENNMETKIMKSYSNYERICIANMATRIVQRMSGFGAAVKCWVAHDPALTEVSESIVGETSKSLGLINNYFGPQIALYFGYLGFYTRYLLPAMFGGGLMFLHQILYGEVDSPWLPVFCLGITIWSTFYLEQWKRHSAELAYAWGVYGCEDKELTEQLAKGAGQEVGSSETRRALSAVVVLVLVYTQVRIMLWYNHVQANSASYFGENWYGSVLPPVLYFALCNLSGAIFIPASACLNAFEKHPTKAQAEGALVVKRFAFNCVNQYSALLYAAFWQKDLQRVRSLSTYALVMHAASNHFMNYMLPALLATVHTLFTKKAPIPEGEAAVECSPEAQQWETLLQCELRRPEVDLQDDYLEMAVQFGHISMFAVAFPLGPVLALISNVLEQRSDFAKLCKSRRPSLTVRSSIGAWQNCLEFLSFAAVFTNCYLLAIVSGNIKAIIPSDFHNHLETDWGRLAAMMAVEHALIALKLGIMLLVDDVPLWVRESLARDRLRAEELRIATHHSSVQSLERRGSRAGGSLAAEDTVPGTPTSGAATELSERTALLTPRTATSPFPASEQWTREEGGYSQTSASASVRTSHRGEPFIDAAAASAASKLSQECSSQFGFDPINMSALVAVPPLLQHFGASPFFYVPLAVLYFSYLQVVKDRSDRKAAIGIISDPALIRFVVKEMPRWVSDSEHQRVEWFNAVVQRLWPQLSLAAEPVLISQIQEVLNAQVIAVRLGLTVKRVSLGSVSPKIVSIRLHDTQESVVRLDVEVRWAGDPQVCIHVGQSQLAPPVELTEVRLSALIRIELLDLMPSLPCFRAVSITCMSPPEVHFSLKVASLDFMNMGPADFNVTALVRTAIDSVLQGIVVYPKKMVFPVVDDTSTAGATQEDDTEAENAGESAVGVLYITFQKGLNIKRSSLFGSNPYVTARTAKGQSFRSKTVFGSRNPVWEQTFELLVFDPATQVLEVEVRDADPTRSGVSLGRYCFGLHNLKPACRVDKTVDLKEVDTGSLVLSYEYIPLQSAAGAKECVSEDEDAEGSEVDSDIIFPMESDVLYSSDAEIDRDHRPLVPHITTAEVSIGPTTAAAGGALPRRSLASLQGRGHIVVSRRFTARYSVGIVSVSMIHIRNLKADSFFQSALRPYVELTIGTKSKQTKPQPGATFPHFSEKFAFIVKDLAEQQLIVAVKSRRKVSADRLLGSVAIALSEVVLSEGRLEQEYMLHGTQAECFVGLRIEVTASSSS